MEKEHSQIRFEVCIEDYRNFTWQGKLTTEGRVIEFKSDLELLLTIDKLVSHKM